jgi:hypothetical protein
MVPPKKIGIIEGGKPLAVKGDDRFGADLLCLALGQLLGGFQIDAGLLGPKADLIPASMVIPVSIRTMGFLTCRKAALDGAFSP